MSRFFLSLATILLFVGIAPAQDINVPKPTGDLNIKIGETSGISFSRLPSRVTDDRLRGKGWKIETVGLKGIDLIAEAVSSGTVQLARFQVLDAFRAIEKGGKLTVLLEDRPDEFIMIARKGITKCSDLNGKRYGVQNIGAPYALMSEKWMKEKCGAKPTLLVISGGENRIVALMNGQLDATSVQLSDWITLNTERPNEFPILMKFAEDLPGLLAGVLIANKPWLEKNTDVAVAYSAEILLDNRKIASDPKPLEAAAMKYQTKDEVKVFPQTYQAYQKDLGGFRQNGGLTAERLKGGIELYTGLGLVKPGLTVERVSTLAVLEGALKIVGKVPGKP
jgi:ABC-type nitrate/sulfonate/bicarbonate transport system substrate-binding protein